MNYYCQTSALLPHAVAGIYDYEVEAGDPMEGVLFPVGLVQVTFINRGIVDMITPDGVKQSLGPGLYIGGQFTRGYHYHFREPIRGVGMVLYPEAIQPALDLDMRSILNSFRPLSDYFSGAKRWHDRLHDQIDCSDFLMSQLDLMGQEIIGRSAPTPSRIYQIFQMIRRGDPVWQVNNILDTIPVSRSYVERQFKQITGMAPGQYLRIIRFKRLLSEWMNKGSSLKELIEQYGYFDHSHLYRDFELYLGCSPADLKEEQHRFLQIMLESTHDMIQKQDQAFAK